MLYESKHRQRRKSKLQPAVRAAIDPLENRTLLSASLIAAAVSNVNIEVPGQGAAAFAQSTTAANPPAVVTLNNQDYLQTFDAEFSGTTLNTNQWNTDLAGQLSEPVNGDMGIASASQDIVSGGQLLLEVSAAPAGTVSPFGKASYLQGAVNTANFVLAPNSIFQWQGVLNWDHVAGWATSVNDADRTGYIGEIDNGEALGQHAPSDQVHLDPTAPPSPAPASGIVSSPANYMTSYPGGVTIVPTQLNTYTAVYNADGTVTFYVTPTYGPGANQTYLVGTSGGFAFNPSDPRSTLALFFSTETEAKFNSGDFDGDANGITTTANVMKADGDTTPQTRDYAMAVNWARVYTAASAISSINVTSPPPQTAIAGQSQAFSLGNFAETNASGPYTVSVNWGDGTPNSTFMTTAAGAIPAVVHTFAASGATSLSVTVTDSVNDTASGPLFSVNTAAPAAPSLTVTPAPSQSAIPGQSQLFALGSFTQNNATGPFTVTVDWGDGSAGSSFAVTSAGTIPAMAHTFAGAGSESVTVTVTDSANNTSNSPTFAVAVASPVASITVTPPAAQTAVTGQSQLFALGSFTQTNAIGPFTVSVDWGDGSPDSTFTIATAAGAIPAAMHPFAVSGLMSLQVTVTDAANDTSNSAPFTVTVADPIAAALALTPPAPQTAVPGQSQLFDLGSFTDTDTDSAAPGPFMVTVDWGDGSGDDSFAVQSAGAIGTLAHAFAASGSESVNVTVTDSATGTTSASAFPITVAAPAPSIIVTPPAAQTAIAGQSQVLALGSFTETDATGPFTVSVDWGDGTPASSFAVTSAGAIPALAHTFAGNGSESVTVTVTDSANNTSNSPTFPVTVAAPAATITASPAAAQSAIPEQSQLFALGTFTETNAVGAFTVSVNWGDGTPASSVVVTSPGTIPPMGHIFAGSGNDSVTVIVTDSANHSSNSSTFVVTVANPVAITVIPPVTQLANRGETDLFFLGSFSQTNATGPFTVNVNWGDGSANSNFVVTSAGTLPVMPHAFSGSGSDSVTVTVIDSANNTSNSPTFTVTVPLPPATITVKAPAAQTATFGKSQSIALGSFTQANAAGPFTVTVNWGDGSANSNVAMTSAGAIPAMAHTFAASGKMTVTVTVVDSAKHTSNIATFAVTVAVPVATITATPPAAQTATRGKSQSFALGSFTQANATGPFTVTVNWGDGSGNSSFSMTSAGTIPAVAHTFAATGKETVTVKVTDSANHTSNSATFAVTVAVPVTTITVTPPAAQSALLGQSQSFALGSFTQANAAGPFTVTVNWGDGSANSKFSINAAGTIPAQAHTFAAGGSKTVTVTVTDSAGHASNSSTFAVTVASASITGTVFIDSNDDGVKQSAESAVTMTGWTVYADLNNNGKLDAGEPSAAVISTGHYTITGLKAGQYIVRTVARTGYKQTAPTTAVKTTVAAGKTAAGPSFFEVPTGPYGGKPAAFGRIQAENFDLGGQGNGYHNPGNVNTGGLYRPAEGVGIGALPAANGGGYFVGWTTPGEYLNYTVTVAATGTYTLNFRVASLSKGGTFHLNVDGKNATGELSVPSTGSWNIYTTISKTGVKLTAGTHVLQLVMDSAGAGDSIGNFDWLEAVRS